VLEDPCDADLAEDAEAALELLEKDHFDVLLTDLRLPTEDGMKLIVRAKSLSKPPSYILMTAYGSEDHPRSAEYRRARKRQISSSVCRSFARKSLSCEAP
jgi:two-component system response regulator AtoC